MSLVGHLRRFAHIVSTTALPGDRTHLRAGGCHFLPATEVNGTVAGELERRWNEALMVVHRIESEIAWIEDFHLQAVDHARHTKKAREKPRAFVISVEVWLN
jgi:hypothetical protein